MKIMKKATNATRNKGDSRSQWNAEFCLCALTQYETNKYIKNWDRYI